MYKFSDLEYKRPDMEEFENKFTLLLESFDKGTLEEQNEAIYQINELRNHFYFVDKLVSIRHHLDISDEFYQKETDFMNWAEVRYNGLISKYYYSLNHSEFKEQLKEKWGRQLFRIAEQNEKTYSPEVIEDLRRENELADEYMKLIATSQAEFQEKKLGFMELLPYMESKDRDIRKKAHIAFTSIFEENMTKLDQLYDQLVKTRDKIAKKLGYENFLGLGYNRLSRTDYNGDTVKIFREQVAEYIVPLALKLCIKQADRLGLESLKYYDESTKFLSGNAVIKCTEEEIIEKSKIMYNELSLKTKEFFEYMVENELLDVFSRKNKAFTGYTTFISEYQSPFIFANFNGSSMDVNIITHEAGHAFQMYCSRNFEIPEYVMPTTEAAEIQSMTMELITFPWMNLFFGEDADKYRFSLLNDAILSNILVAVLGDEFQHWVYENPDVTPKQRRERWTELEQKYLPFRDYEDNEFLKAGGLWFRYLHFFKVPLYLIDYALAQVCALQFFVKFRENREAAWEDYLNLCNAGGSRSYTELLKIAGLKNPFEDGCVQSIIKPVTEIFDTLDDKKYN